MGCCKCCAKLIGICVLAVALLVGYLRTCEHPLAPVFITIFKLRGLGKPGTEPVPDGLAPATRPEGEMFFDLPGGDKMPGNGIGMCCRPTAYDPDSVYSTVLWFLLQGGRHIDTASMYMNHEAVGKGMKEAIARGVPRKEIFLVTKVFGDHFGYDASIDRARRMLKELDVDYIDLLLLHAPFTASSATFAKIIYNLLVGAGGTVESKISYEPEMKKLRIDTWKGLSTLKEEGLIRNLGVSNFNIDHMTEIQDLKLAPIAANQVQYHPWVPTWMHEVVKYCHDNNIVVTGYFSLGGMDHKDKVAELDTVAEIAKAHGRRPAQILLRWSLQKNVSIIPGTGNHKHMADNLATYGFSLSDQDMKKLDGMSSLPISKDFIFFDV